MRSRCWVNCAAKAQARYAQQCACDKGQYNQKHCRPDGDILGSDAAEIQCKPAATDRVGSQHAAKCKKYHAEQRPYRAADDLSSNVLPNGHGQSQHQIPALAQQAVKPLNFNKKQMASTTRRLTADASASKAMATPASGSLSEVFWTKWLRILVKCSAQARPPQWAEQHGLWI